MIISGLIATSVSEVCKELAREMPRLKAAVQDQPLVNLTFDPDVLSALLGVRCLVLLGDRFVEVVCGGDIGGLPELRTLQHMWTDLEEVTYFLINVFII